MLFGRKWNQIAKYVPGRIQSQCRDRYLNSLDPSLKWGGWTEEEDLRLEAAIAKHGYCWSKIAEEVPPRTDSQCRKRWKVLCPEQVPLLQEARKKQRSIIGSNFVDRESERPTITLNDFLPLLALAPKSDFGASNIRKKRKSSNVPKKASSKKGAKRTQRTKEVRDRELYHDDESYPVSACSNLPKKKIRLKRRTKSSNSPQELVDISCSDKVTCIEGSENQSTCIPNSENQESDSITLACFLRNKSNEILSRFTKNLSQTSFSSRITDVPEQVESQNPSDDQGGLSRSCETVGTKNLFVQLNVASDRRVRNQEDDDDNDDHMTLACFLKNKPKKEGQPIKGHGVRSSKLKTGSVLVNEEHCASKSTFISDDSEPSVSKHNKEMETVLHGCVAKPINIIVEEEDDERFTSRVQNRPRRERKCPSRFL